MSVRTLPAFLLLAAALVPACSPRRAHTPPPVDPEPVVAPLAEAPEPVVLEMEAALANRTVEAGTAGEVLARIRIVSPESGNGERPRANIGLVVDTSASMEGEAIEQARGAALTLLDGLRDGDVLSVVTFGSVVEVLVPATVLDAQSRPHIRTALGAMRATGTTNLAEGLGQGLQQVQSQARGGEINRIVLLSDGVPNDESPVHGYIELARNSGISITALGLGLEYHETLLGQIAQGSGGNFHFVEDPAEVAKVFGQEVLSIDRLAARAVSLTLTPGPGVSIVEVPGHAMNHSGHDVVLALPDMIEGDVHQVIVRLAVAEHRDGATVEMFDGVVNYADARTNLGQSVRTFLSAKATADAEQRAAGVDLEVAVAAARATTAAATLEIVALARGGQVKAATAKLDDTVKAARDLSQQVPDPQLAKLVDDLVELRPTLAGLAPKPVAAARGGKSKGKASMDGGEDLVEVLDTGTGAVMVAPEPMAPSAARGVRQSHERAFRTLHDG
ncbi:MAG: VWA domain-containing protein [Myxococcales bacterium]|nr:VWA domain-containing protein [Myxococcales bacterium]